MLTSRARLILISLALAPPALAGKVDAKAVHAAAIVIDTHADTPQRFLDEGVDFGAEASLKDGQLDLPKARAGNLAAEFFSIWVEPRKFQGRYARRALELVDAVAQQVERRPGEMVLALTADDIVKARTGKQKRFAALMGIEGGHAIENDLRLLRNFYRLGVRYMTLTWSNTNDWADSSGDLDKANVTHHDGLTDFGREVVKEMNRLGMMVDVSHVADATFFDALEVSQAPVIASHSSARALTDSKRNLTDDMLRAVAKNNGVVMVNFYSAFIDEDYRKAYTAQGAERSPIIDALELELRKEAPGVAAKKYRTAQQEWSAKLPRPPLKSLVDHIDHIAKIAGVSHVGLGSDFDGVSSTPEGIDSAADLPKITAALAERGYTAEQLKQILGGNLLRVMRDVEKVAKELQKRPAPPPTPAPAATPAAP